MVAILFDYDGVIADAMGMNLKAWQSVFESFGVEIEPTEYLKLEGSGPREIARYLCQLYGLEADLAELIAQKKDQVYQTLGETPLYPGILPILSGLRQRGTPLALVTGASRQRISRTVPAEVLGCFNAVVTSDDVKKTKPAPEPYLTGMKLLGVDYPREASQTIVVENAPLGIQSAKAAGAFCIALTTTLPPEQLQGADLILGSHSELADFLGQ